LSKIGSEFRGGLNREGFIQMLGRREDGIRRQSRQDDTKSLVDTSRDDRKMTNGTRYFYGCLGKDSSSLNNRRDRNSFGREVSGSHE